MFPSSVVPCRVWKDTQGRSTHERKPAPCLGIQVQRMERSFLSLSQDSCLHLGASSSLHLPPFSPASSFRSLLFLDSLLEGLSYSPRGIWKFSSSVDFSAGSMKKRAATDAQWVFTFFSMADLKYRQDFSCSYGITYSITSVHDLPIKSVFYTTKNGGKFLPASCSSSHFQFTHQIYSVFPLWV